MLVFEVARSLARRFPQSGEDSIRVGGAAALVGILAPFAAFHQRIALAESLFLCESLLAALLALRLAFPAENSSRSEVGQSVAFGAVMGAAMLTRQNFSYVLWALPLCAVLALPAEKRSPAPSFLRRMAVAGAVSLLLWAPILIQKTGPDLKTRVFHVAGFRAPLPLAERVRHAAQVAMWFWTYLTPPIAFLSVAALAWLLGNPRRPIFTFLVLWVAIVLAPLLLFGSLLYPRYTFTAAAPLWIACGFLLADLRRRLGKAPVGPLARGLLGASALAVSFAWPVRDLALQCFRWQDQTLVPEDRWQYVTGWPAGSATEQAIRWLRVRAAAEPLVLITPDVSGNPGDTTWVLLSRERTITLFSSSDAVTGRILTPAPDRPGAFLLSGDLRKMIPPVPVQLPIHKPIYFLAPDPFVTRTGWRRADEFFGKLTPGISVAARFENPAPREGRNEGMTVFRLR